MAKGVHSQYSNSDTKKLLCTNIDGTLIGHDESMYELLGMINRHGLLLVFDTGRDLKSVVNLIDKKGIRKPDASICMVGTEVYFVQDGEFVLDRSWSDIISRGWNRQRIVEMMSDLKDLEWQESRWQTKFKISYFLRYNQQEVLAEIHRRLQEEPLDVKVIFSCDQFLDLLPRESSKSGALKYIMAKLGIAKDDVIVCGDSGNDLELFEDGFKGIIVANAHQELKDYKGSNAFHATYSYSAGIIEGLKQFRFI
ncbi:MAG: sucrose-phosphate phosphatase [Dehalococcoidia bacterium]